MIMAYKKESPATQPNRSGKAEHIQRGILRIPGRPYLGVRPASAKDPSAQFSRITPLRPPNGAPNVLSFPIDDAGFVSCAPFGGPHNALTFEVLAKNGLRYTRLHTAAICSATRAALLTGRNPQTVGFATVTEIATSAPEYTGMIRTTALRLRK
jgi:hypothetical protein